MNHEGYRDPTADRAVRKADKMPKHIRKIFDALNTVCECAGDQSGRKSLTSTPEESGNCDTYEGGDAGGDQKARYEAERS